MNATFFVYLCSLIDNCRMVEFINTKESGCLYMDPSIIAFSIDVQGILCESPYDNEPMKEKDISEAFEFEQE